MLRTLSALNPLSYKSQKEENMATSADSISITEFNQALNRYPALIKAIGKNAKDGAVPLEDLDKFRYVDAPARFSKKGGARSLELSDLQKLVEWKLRHGNYHPGFAKRIAANSNEQIKDATEDAFGYYAKNSSEIETVIKKLSALNGVGPATASLLLAVHDPDHVIYFSDELFKWLINDGASKPSPKYHSKEFEDLFAKAKAITSKLRVSPISLEKVAFVLIKENEPVREKAEPKVPSGRGRGRPALPDSEKKAKKPTVPGRGRGRPAGTGVTKAKVAKTPKAAKVAKSPAAATASGGGKKRGRPAKAAEEEAEPTPASATPGKKRKAADDETPAKKGKKAKA
jgi:hypothetical protein